MLFVKQLLTSFYIYIYIYKAKHDFDPIPVLPDINNLEPEVETEATADSLSTLIDQGLPTTNEPELDETAHSAAVAEGSSEVVTNADATGGIELRSEFEQEITSAQETGVDVVSSSKDALTAVVAHGVETEVESETHGTDGDSTTNDLAAGEFPETEQPVMPTSEVFIFNSCGDALANPVLPLKGDSTGHVNEAAIVVGLVTAGVFSRMEQAVPEGIHEAAPEAGNDSVESGTTLDIEPQREREVDVAAPETEDTLSDVDSSLWNAPTPVPLPLEPEISLVETELVPERQVDTTTNDVPIAVEVQPDPISSETEPNAQNDIEVQTQVDDTSNIKDEPILESDITQRIEAADAEAPFRNVPASSTRESESTVQLEPEVDFVAPAEEEPLAITQATAEDQIESEVVISQTPGETIIPGDATTSVANVDVPVDVRSEQHAAVVETSYSDELAEVILPPDVEKRPETMMAQVEPSYKSSDDEMKGVSVVLHFQCIPEV